MDYQDIIKLQEQSIVYSTGNHSYRCMASFYDNDSQGQKRLNQNNQNFIDNYQQNYQNYRDEYTSQQVIYRSQIVSQVIDYVQKYLDITDMPLQEILKYIDQIQIAQGLNKVLLRKKILKRKNILKRYRAKNRKSKIIFNSFNHYNYVPMIQQNNGDNQTQIKKKRNRVSAQISRDKKKQYFKELQEKNTKLEEEILKAKLQNEQLKKTIIEQNNKSNNFRSNQTKDPIKNHENDKKNNFFQQSLNNKLTRLLIFLGILCLIGMLKDTFFSAGEGLSKFNTTQKLNQMGDFRTLEQFKLLEQGHQMVTEFLQEQGPQKEISSMIAEDKNKIFKYINVDQPKENSGKRFKFFQNLISRLENMKDQIYKKSC